MPYNRIWDTELVNDTLQKFRYGEDVNLDCFHQRDPELKGDNVLFQLTHKEEAEFNKCSQEIEYFVETYCRFLTDYGRITVELRDFQSDILNTLGEEVWIANLKNFGPKVRNYILMASRQVGKCLFSSEIIIKFKDSEEIIKIPLVFIYYFNKEKLSFLEKIKLKLLILYYKISKW